MLTTQFIKHHLPLNIKVIAEKVDLIILNEIKYKASYKRLQKHIFTKNLKYEQY